MNTLKKTIILCLCLLLLIVVIILSYIKAYSIYKKLTLDIEKTRIYSFYISPILSNSNGITVEEEDIIYEVKLALKGVEFDGLIREKDIIRTEEKNYCLLFLSCDDDIMSYELQVTGSDYDQCYIRPSRGLFSENVYIKITNCQELYELLWSLIQGDPDLQAYNYYINGYGAGVESVAARVQIGTYTKTVLFR